MTQRHAAALLLVCSGCWLQQHHHVSSLVEGHLHQHYHDDTDSGEQVLPLPHDVVGEEEEEQEADPTNRIPNETNTSSDSEAATTEDPEASLGEESSEERETNLLEEEDCAKEAYTTTTALPTMQDVNAALHEYKGLQERLTLLQQGQDKLQEELQTNSLRFSSLMQTTQRALAVLREKVNVVAVRHVQDQLAELQRLEYEAREATLATVAEDVGTTDDAEDDDDGLEAAPARGESQYLTRDALDDLLSPSQLFREHDARLVAWCSQILEQATDDLLELDEVNDALEVALEQFEEESQNNSNRGATATCASPVQAAQLIQTALAKVVVQSAGNGGGFYDHAQQAGWIVHELTSETYQTTALEQDEDKELAAWWLQYVPEDWMDALAYLSSNDDDTAQQWLQKGAAAGAELLSQLRGGSISATNPPESVLHPLLLPGACWPLADSTGGRVTIALPYSVRLSALSIHHASRLLLLDGDRSTSAPRTILATGYPPCDEDDKEACQGLTFDIHDPIPLGQFEYNLQGPPAQTFVMEYKGEDGGTDDCSDTAPSSEDDDSFLDDEPDDDKEEAAGLCTKPPPSLTRDDRIAAVQFQIVENYGHPDYTCLYRLGIHGERA